MEFLDNLTTFQSVLFYIAVPTTVIFLAMTIATFMGMDGGGDMDIDVEVETDVEADGAEAPFQLFTLRNLIGFFLGLSWGGLSGIEQGFTETGSIFLGVMIGAIVVLIQSSLFYFLSKLQETNEPSNASAVGQTGRVYLTVPSNGNGFGKITVNVSGKVATLNAITRETTPLKTGTPIVVTSLEGDTAIVQKQS